MPEPSVNKKLRVKTEDGATDVRGVHTIEVTDLTLTNDGGGTVSITTGGGGGGGGTPGGSNTQVQFNDGGAFGGDSGLTYNKTAGSRLLKIVDTGFGTMFQIESTDEDATSAPDMVMLRNSASPANGDDLGVIVFKGMTSTGAEHEYARISAEANVVTNGAEDGQLDLRCHAAGSLKTQLRILETGVHVNPANDSTVDFRVDSQATDQALFVDASANTLAIAVASSISSTLTVSTAATADDPSDVQLSILDGRTQIGKVPIEQLILDQELMSQAGRQGRVLVLAQTDYSIGDTNAGSAGGPSLIDFTAAGVQGLTFGIWNTGAIAANVRFTNGSGGTPTITQGIVNGTGATAVGIEIPAYTFVTVLAFGAGEVGFLGDVNVL